MTKAEKTALTKEINALKKYIADCENEIENQTPQPDGRIYLHGDVIARKVGNSVFEKIHLKKFRYDLKLSEQKRKQADVFNTIPFGSPKN